MEDTESLLVPRVTVEGNTLVSKGFPEGTVAVDDVLSYVGGETFILYDAARCEVHLFAEADEGGESIVCTGSSSRVICRRLCRGATITRVIHAVP